MPGLPHIYLIVRDVYGVREALNKIPDRDSLFVVDILDSVAAAKQRLAESQDGVVRAVVVDFHNATEDLGSGTPTNGHLSSLADATTRCVIGVSSLDPFLSQLQSAGCDIACNVEKLHEHVATILCNWGHITAEQLAAFHTKWKPPEQADGQAPSSR